MDSPTSKSWSDGLLSSLSMILVSEIGDKTFFIACLMAMRHPKLLVFCGAASALAAMTVLSALMGLVVPNVLSVRLTEIMAIGLFFFFGGKILYDELLKRNSNEQDSEDEMTEAAAVLRKKDPNDALETGSNLSVGSGSAYRRWPVLHPIMIEAFALTFVAEWGDRSQLATIALAAAKNPYAVTLGGVFGHLICTGGAVLFGNMIAQHVSMKTVNVVGGLLFIVFAFGTLYELLTQSHHIDTLERQKHQ
ncbi:putative membrane protein [Trypanosoma grayi]|uniref:putative membrane protein n=1 Tax=Trypanosoma grayi TaxID=71804 RepID=UPI0004F4955C|nr:putative membrane protein [Trypanosoma grayi]KEG12594.1 putative membrane protein [Trypanosoma grayi]